ncbi:alpha/beta hydrolase fold domain-containing protein [Oceanobacillus sp. CAU 1775]
MKTVDNVSKESLRSKGFKLILKIFRRKAFWDKTGDDLLKAIATRRLLSYEPPNRLKKHMKIEKKNIDGFHFYELRPFTKTSNKFIYYTHGGAYVHRISKYHWNFLGKLMQELNCVIIIPLYPLAPEHTYKDTIKFTLELYELQLQTIDKSSEIILMGDSAGGGLALVLAQIIKDTELQQPEKIVMISPWLDVSLTNPAIEKFEEDDLFLVKTGLVEVGKMYAGDIDTKDPKVSPIYGDLHGLGDLTLMMGTHDLLVADARKFIEITKEQGIDVTYIEAPKMLHVYPIFNFPESKQAFVEVVKELNKKKKI